MSGGVDSSVAAGLLAEKDYDLSAVFMRNWDTRDESGTDDWEDVQRVCRIFSIPCRMVDLHRQYWSQVFEPSLNSWESGSTPNPDVWCNREVKFGALLRQLVRDSQTLWLATGHYARKDWQEHVDTLLPRPRLLRARDLSKDQTYYLSSIPESSLSRALFPLGEMQKKEVRKLASKWGLPTAVKEESMGICFVGEKRKFNEFLCEYHLTLSHYIPPNPGPIIDMTNSQQIATHQGLWNYTIGQGAKIGGCRTRMFVAKKDPETNTVFVVPGSHNPALHVNIIHVSNFDWIWTDRPPKELQQPSGMTAQVKYRHCMESEGCVVHRDENELRITLGVSQKGIASGQVVALYLHDWCLGCGVIDSAEFKG
ncbi:tRNA-specific 2-thiouridylase [Pisolithus marmoratus]|nr:tRNA-specific 2-thiouridylase [Pisolithus marmoratus]